jgi:hypothetical protein
MVLSNSSIILLQIFNPFCVQNNTITVHKEIILFSVPFSSPPFSMT